MDAGCSTISTGTQPASVPRAAPADSPTRSAAAHTGFVIAPENRNVPENSIAAQSQPQLDEAERRPCYVPSRPFCNQVYTRSARRAVSGSAVPGAFQFSQRVIQLFTSRAFRRTAWKVAYHVSWYSILPSIFIQERSMRTFNDVGIGS